MTHHTALANLHPVQALKDWFARRHEAALDAEEARRIASDLGISVEDLTRMSHDSADETALMTQMLAMHGLDRAKLEQAFGAVMRDMAVTCSRCGNKAECRHDLATGEAIESFDDFCANAEVIRDFAKTAAQ